MITFIFPLILTVFAEEGKQFNRCMNFNINVKNWNIKKYLELFIEKDFSISIEYLKSFDQKIRNIVLKVIIGYLISSDVAPST